MDVMSLRRSLLSNQSYKLPDIYQQVEWIQSSGTQYIDTGFCPSNETVVKITGVYINSQTPLGLSNNFFGSFDTDNGGINRFAAYCMGPYLYFYFGKFSIQNQTYANSSTYIEGNNTVIFSKNGIFKNNVHVAANADKTEVFSSNVTAYIFAAHSATSGPSGAGSSRIARVDIVDGSIRRAYVPCYRISDGEIGMYETVTRTFLTNQGTGTFTKGNDV